MTRAFCFVDQRFELRKKPNHTKNNDKKINREEQ
jgi:hypothetical protein